MHGTITEVEPLNEMGNPTRSHLDLKELAGLREECADLRAKIYLADKEKSSLQLSLEERNSVEAVLRTHIDHLQEEVARLNRGEGRLSSLTREDMLRQRVDKLLDTLNRVTRNSEVRHKQSDELVGDLKRANR